MSNLDSEKMPYPCGLDRCGHNPRVCGKNILSGDGCLKWRRWFSAKWSEVTEPLKRMSKPTPKAISQEEKLNSLLSSSKCPIAFASKEIQRKAVEWLISGGVMIPQCKPGDVLWYANDGRVGCDVVKRIQFIQSGEEEQSTAEGWIVFCEKNRFRGCEIGVNVFFNMRDAEAYAAKMKGEENEIGEV